MLYNNQNHVNFDQFVTWFVIHADPIYWYVFGRNWSV